MQGLIIVMQNTVEDVHENKLDIKELGKEDIKLSKEISNERHRSNTQQTHLDYLMGNKMSRRKGD